MSTVFWTAHAPAAPAFAPLASATACEVLVVGGGILGCAAALRLRELGVEVCLLEAEQIGAGASGRNGGLVVPSLARVGPEDARRLLGEDAGARLTSTVAASAARVFDVIKRYGMDCDAVQNGWINPCHAVSLAPGMQARARAWARVGGQARWLDSDTTQATIGSCNYVGAIFDPSGGHLNPLAYTRALARAAAALGARIHSASPVHAIERVRDHWRVHTPTATVRARHVLQCSHIQHPEITQRIQANILTSCIPLTVYQFASQVIPASLRSRVLPHNTALSDARNNLFACRWTSDDRLVVGGMAAITHWRALERLKRSVARRAARVFPQLGKVQFDYGWSGRAALTPDFLPRIFRLGEHWLAPLGCNGRGIALSTTLGFALADYLACGQAQPLPLPISPLAPLPAHALARFLPQWLLPLGDGQDRWRAWAGR